MQTVFVPQKLTLLFTSEPVSFDTVWKRDEHTFSSMSSDWSERGERMVHRSSRAPAHNMNVLIVQMVQNILDTELIIKTLFYIDEHI